jgi:hypothetical protein
MFLMTQTKIQFRNIPFEAIIWFAALLSLAITNVDSHPHFTLCPLALAGFDWCPGCGLGRSISLFFHGKLSDSFAMHPLGVFAAFVLSVRIVKLSRQFIKDYGKGH